ncbi:hypothetical protein ACQ858_08550 [Variovorax ureilyticus]|uniref:hypothetical protein n=1 Tax=Variovorax ureilyticus TaxID=1836198 RepID=UPI003D6668C6
MPPDTQPGDLPRVSRIIDMKLPLQWLLGVAGLIAAAFVSTYYQVGQMREDMAELKATVKAGNAQQGAVQSEIAILRYRVENLEADKKAAAR